jgi:hypothetical protein
VAYAITQEHKRRRRRRRRRRRKDGTLEVFLHA